MSPTCFSCAHSPGWVRSGLANSRTSPVRRVSLLCYPGGGVRGIVFARRGEPGDFRAAVCMLKQDVTHLGTGGIRLARRTAEAGRESQADAEHYVARAVSRIWVAKSPAWRCLGLCGQNYGIGDSYGVLAVFMLLASDVVCPGCDHERRPPAELAGPEDKIGMMRQRRSLHGDTHLIGTFGRSVHQAPPPTARPFFHRT